MFMFSRSWKKVPTKPPNVVTVVLLDGCFCITHPDVHGNFCSKWITAAPLMLQSALTEPASMQKCSTLSLRKLLQFSAYVVQPSSASDQWWSRQDFKAMQEKTCLECASSTKQLQCPWYWHAIPDITMSSYPSWHAFKIMNPLLTLAPSHV